MEENNKLNNENLEQVSGGTAELKGYDDTCPHFHIGPYFDSDDENCPTPEKYKQYKLCEKCNRRKPER